MKRFFLLLVVLSGGALVASAHAATIADGDFTNWSFSSFQQGTASATVTREPTGGNPGARLNITTVTNPTDSAFGTAIKNDFSTNAPLSGAFTLYLVVGDGDNIQYWH